MLGHHRCKILATSGLINFVLLILVVGRDGVLGSSASHDLRCGRQLVSGLFSRPRLPIGYSYIATVPRGACRLNVSVVLPSENYIALKLVNGSYIINGEFAVSTSGSYEAAGARFIYRRIASQDYVYAHGPLLQPIDIMVLYTQPNPSIKYEYLTDSGELKDDDKRTVTQTPKHARRHHNFDSLSSISPTTSTKSVKHPYQGDMLSAEDDTEIKGRENIIGSKKFVWKILSFSQCSRTCGGGNQLGKYRCVEDTYKGAEREVSSVHCKGSPPINKRKRCGFAPCPPKWRSTSWSKCPDCGPANRTRLVGCVQDHSRGIIKVSDVKCPPYKPSTIEPCNIPDCDNYSYNEDIQTTPEPKTKISGRDRAPEIEAFHAGPVYTVSVNGTDNDVGPEYSYGVVGGWLHTDWSECVGWCVGGGIETREVKCTDPAGCAPKRTPETSRTCTPSITCDKHDGQWFTGEWSTCSSLCKGRQIRGVLCIGNSGRHLRESACKGPRPDHERNCGTECNPTWYTSDWSQCAGGCLNVTGLQRRTVWCARGDGPASPDADCTTPKPIAQKSCTSTTQCSTKTTTITDAPKILPKVDIESQVKTDNEIPEENHTKDCKDKLGNCQLAVQARLCHYNYYSENCCHSCQKR